MTRFNVIIIILLFLSLYDILILLLPSLYAAMLGVDKSLSKQIDIYLLQCLLPRYALFPFAFHSFQLPLPSSLDNLMLPVSNCSQSTHTTSILLSVPPAAS